MSYPFGPMVTLVSLSNPSTDADGNDVYETTALVVQAQAFDPGSSTEVLGSQDTVTSQPTVYLPAGSVVGAIDQVIVAGVTYDVDGSPNSYTNPFTGWTPGVVVKLKSVTG